MWNKTTPSTNLSNEDYLGLQELPLKGPHSFACPGTSVWLTFPQFCSAYLENGALGLRWVDVG